MKNFLTFFSIFTVLISLSGQGSVELQMGGSNFLGVSLNYSYEIMMVKDLEFSASPRLGVGTMVVPAHGTDAIFHTGLDFRRKRWGIGGEASRFMANPLFGERQSSGFIALLLYPNANYSIAFKNGLYFKFSAGLYLPFDRAASSGNSNIIPRYQFVDDLIPGAGVTVGYTIYR